MNTIELLSIPKVVWLQSYIELIPKFVSIFSMKFHLAFNKLLHHIVQLDGLI